MRILHTSDWHLGRSLEQISRIGEQRAFVDCLCQTAGEQDVDLVLVAGDVFDTYNPSAAAEELFYDALERLNGGGRRAVIVIAGNHDNPDRLCAASPLARKNGIILLGYPASDAGAQGAGAKNFVVDSGPGWFELAVPGCAHHAVIITLPYPSESRLEEVVSRQADEGALQKAYSEKIGALFASLSQNFREDTVNLAVGHLFLRGGKQTDSERTLQVGGAMTVDPAVLPANAHFVAMGHLHRPQRIDGAPCPAVYAGSPLAYSFSETEHSKAVYVVDAAPGREAEITAHYLDCGKPLRRWVAEDGIEQALGWCEEGRDLNAWVDLEIVTDRVLTLEEQRALRSLHPGIVNIRPRLRSEASALVCPQRREGMRIDELFRDYYRAKMQAEVSGELMEAFMEIVNDEGEEAGADETEAS